MSTKRLDTYTTTTAGQHATDKRTIATILANYHRGRDNTISSADLAEHTNCGASTVRDLIPQIRREYRLPIGSANGYFVIETREEYARQVERQLKQAETSRQTARDISAAYNSGDAL